MLELTADRRLVGVPGEDPRRRRELHQLHHRRAADLRRPTADRVLEQHVAREADLVVDDECDAVVGVARQRDRTGAEAAGDEIAGHDGDAEARAQVVLVLDVIGVRVRPQEVRRRQALALDELEQRAERGTAVDEHRRAAGRVADDVGVRQPPLVHRPTDDHATTLRKIREPG